MTALAIDHLSLGFTIIAAIGLIGWGGLIAFFWPDLWRPSRRKEADAERLEVDGPFADLTAERQKRINRAALAQRDRWSRSA